MTKKHKADDVFRAERLQPYKIVRYLFFETVWTAVGGHVIIVIRYTYRHTSVCGNAVLFARVRLSKRVKTT